MREAKEEEDEEESRNHPRLMIQKFLSDEECRELEFIHKSCSTVGYRPNVFSTTLSHLAATNSHHLIIPFVPIRERLKEKAEEFFDCQFELFVEFTGLISWIKGASIGWHSDDNRPYLKQRDFAAVCYLNSHGIDFKGGLFHFQDGEPTTIVPSCGDVVMYTADTRNIHSVDEIADGERLTLTLWFSHDSSHDEDAKLVSILSQSLLDNDFPDSCLPFPASTNMYWFSPNQESNLQTGFDICCARLHILGYDVHGSQDKISCSDSSELLIKPLRVARGNQLFDHEFANILHALQVVQFYFWKGTELHASHISADNYKVVELSQIQLQEISCLKSVYLTDHELAETILSSPTCNKNKQQKLFDWACFAGAAASWEEYVRKLHKEMLGSFPHWKTQQSIFKVSGTCL